MAGPFNRQDQDQNRNRIVSQIDRFERLLTYTGNDEVLPWRDYLTKKDKTAGKSIAFSSGFVEVDFLTGGFHTGELTTISGYTGHGKTLFLKSLIRSFAINNAPVVVFSYEDAVERYFRQLHDENKDYPIYVPLQLQTGNLSWLEERVVEAKLKYNSRIVTIDHLHYLLDMNGGMENISLKMGSIMRFLKKVIAEEHNMTVFIVAHQMKATDSDAEASLETIRDSGLIGNESDHVFIVQRLPDQKVKHGEEATYENKYGMVKIEKSRRNGVFRKRLTFQKQGEWFSPI